MVFLFGMRHPSASLRTPGALMRVDMQGPVWLSGGEGGLRERAFPRPPRDPRMGVQRPVPVSLAPGIGAYAWPYNPARLMIPPRAVLAAPTFSEPSRVALVLAARLARHCGA